MHVFHLLRCPVSWPKLHLSPEALHKVTYCYLPFTDGEWNHSKVKRHA